MKIDVHHHFWRYRPHEFPWIAPQQIQLHRDFLPREFEVELRSAGFDRSIVIQARQNLEETRWLLELADLWPFLGGVVGWVDLCSREAESQIQTFASHPKLVGLRHVVHDELDGFLGRKDFRQGLALLKKYSLTFDLLLFPQHLASAADLAQQFPAQTFVLDHLAKPWAGNLPRGLWKKQLRVLAANPRVTAKLSGLVPEGYPPTWSSNEIRFYLDTAFEVFGEDRLMFASNWPVCLSVGSYSWILKWVMDYLEPFPAATKEKVLGANAAVIYGLRSDNSRDGLGPSS